MLSGPEGVFLGIARRSSFAGETRAPCCQEPDTPRRADSALQSGFRFPADLPGTLG